MNLFKKTQIKMKIIRGKKVIFKEGLIFGSFNLNFSFKLTANVSRHAD